MTTIRDILESKATTPQKQKQLRDLFLVQVSRPHARPETSIDLRQRADRQRGTASQIKTAGGEIKPEYEL